MKNPVEVSVIIATHNRAEVLRTTLESLGRQSVGHIKYEVIVVANGCTDDTATLLTDLKSKTQIVPLFLDRAGKSAALNRGMEVARGKLFAFTDDDVVFSEGWLTELSRASHAHRDAAGFCGPITPIYPEGAPSWIRRHPFKVPGFAEFMPSFSRPQPCPFYLLPFGPNFAIRAEVSCGLLFRTDLGASDVNGPLSCEDTEFASRFRDIAGPIWFIPTASVNHRIRIEQITVAWLVERAFLLGRSLVAQQIPTGTFHPPAWHVGWHPTLWNPFDRSLVINFLIGQLYQCRRHEVSSGGVISDIETHLPELLPYGVKAVLSASAQIFLRSDDCHQIQFLLDDDHTLSEHEILVEG